MRRCSVRQVVEPRQYLLQLGAADIQLQHGGKGDEQADKHFGGSHVQQLLPGLTAAERAFAGDQFRHGLQQGGMSYQLQQG